MTIQRTDTAVALSTKDLPTDAVNPLAPLVLVSAVIPDGTNQLVATFSAPTTDSGAALPNYVGEAQLYDCSIQGFLTLGVAVTQEGDGTVTYDISEIIDPLGGPYEFTITGIAASCAPQVETLDGFYFPMTEVSPATTLSDNSSTGLVITPDTLTFTQPFAPNASMNPGAPTIGTVPQIGAVSSFIMSGVIANNQSLLGSVAIGALGNGVYIFVNEERTQLFNPSFGITQTIVLAEPALGADFVYAVVFDKATDTLTFYRHIVGSAVETDSVVVTDPATLLFDNVNEIGVNGAGTEHTPAFGMWTFATLPADYQAKLTAWRDAALAGNKTSPWTLP